MVPARLFISPEQEQINQAKDLYAQQRAGEAEVLFCLVLEREPDSREPLEYLVGIYLQSGRPHRAREILQRLVEAYPDDPLYCDRLAMVLQRSGQSEKAVSVYQVLLERRPELVTSRYNLAVLLKSLQRYEESLQHYYRALDDGANAPEVLYSNISTIYSELHRDGEARKALDQALDCNPVYTPALYNLGLLLEEQGRWPEARDCFRKILQHQPSYSDAMVRLAYGEKIDGVRDPLLIQLKLVVASPQGSPLERENALFALGKAFDDCAEYAQAFNHYAEANIYSEKRMGRYDRSTQEALTAKLIGEFSASWLAEVEAVSDAAPIFICGMFRSGSTLIEQMLAAHPQLSAGGEINFFNREVPNPLPPLESIRLAELAGKYLEQLSKSFPDASAVTNKRPDNFLYLGLVKALFPNARIIHSQRNALDNCLSIFFQQIDLPGHRYGNNLLATGHYYSQYRKIMDHWRQVFPANLVNICYEDMVTEPEPTLKSILEFLKLEWHPAVLDFHRVENRVRTASTWQVRQPLYRQSMGRWHNYEQQLGDLSSYLSDTGIDV